MPGTVNRTAPPAVDGWLDRLGLALCPPRCLVCGERGAGARDLCAACAATLPWSPAACAGCALPLPAHRPRRTPTLPPPPASTATVVAGHARCAACRRRPPPLDAVHAAFAYAMPVDRLLRRFKFHRDLAAGRLLSEAMATAFADLPRPDALVPVALHRARLRHRGYDQALELARRLAPRLGIGVAPGLLRRVRDTAPQSTLDAHHRQRNVRDAFAVRPGAALPAHVVLVDDVMTTGATLHAAARALRAAGAARVDAWVCARVP